MTSNPEPSGISRATPVPASTLLGHISFFPQCTEWGWDGLATLHTIQDIDGLRESGFPWPILSQERFRTEYLLYMYSYHLLSPDFMKCLVSSLTINSQKRLIVPPFLWIWNQGEEPLKSSLTVSSCFWKSCNIDPGDLIAQSGPSASLK